MKKIILTLFVVIGITSQALAQETQEVTEIDETAMKYEQFTKELSNEAIKIITSDKGNEEKLEAFKTLFIENCNLNSLARFVLAQYWRGLSEDEQADFTESFTNSVIISWATKFNAFKGGELEINSVNKSEKATSKDYFVNSTMKFTDGTQDAEVIWREREDKDGKIKILDISIEGISMAMSYRNEYRAVLQRNNGNVNDLIKSLDEKSAKLHSEFK